MPSAKCFEQAIPDFAERELDRLYGSDFSSVRHLRLRGEDAGASTYVSGDGNTVLIYRKEADTVQLLTYVLQLSAAQVNDFAEFIFERYSGIGKILFPAVALETSQVNYPNYSRIYRSDVVIDPVPAEEQYEERLSRNVRKNLRYYANRLKREHPDFDLQVYDETNFSEADVSEILALSRARIEDKTETWQYSAGAVEDMITLLRQGGMVCVARIDGRLCGGSICYRFGDSYSFQSCGYDPRYAAYRLGYYLCYLGNVEAIRRNARRISLGFMVYEYKLWLGGTARRLDRVAIYRGRLAQLADGPANMADYWNSNLREVFAHARLASHRKDWLGLCLRGARGTLRRLKGARVGPTAG
jgi:hypothetical protein